MPDTRLNIGFIGLGIMGTPMAGHLLHAGHRLFVHTRSAVPVDFADSPATPCSSPRDVAAQADFVFLMLPDTPDVEAVLFGENGVAAGLRAGALVVDMSSISPLATKVFAQRIQAREADYVDAPVSGGEVGAKNATLSIMAGGSEAAFDRVRPLLALMGRDITHVGVVGDGQTAKVANQMIVALNIAAVAEALLFVAKAGADPVRVRKALMGGFAGSKVLEVHGERMLQRRFAPGFRVALHRKDLELALSSARTLGVALPHTAGVQQLFNACCAHGGEGWDHSALLRSLERLSNFEIGQPS